MVAIILRPSFQPQQTSQYTSTNASYFSNETNINSSHHIVDSTTLHSIVTPTMHSIHNIAHRAPGTASRTRVRWQPYGSAITIPASCQISTQPPPRSPYLTPSSVSSSSPYSTPSSSSSSSYDTEASSSSMPAPPKEPKNKYAMGLVDQAVKTLCANWRPQDIPAALLIPDKLSIPTERTTTTALRSKIRNQHLRIPSPLSPKPQPVPPTATAGSELFSCQNNVPIKGFVHEVLRRSRTSSLALQTALCYIEAVRPRISKLAEEEKAGHGVHGEPNLEGRITMATAEEYGQEALLTAQFDDLIVHATSPDIPTIRIIDDEPLLEASQPELTTAPGDDTLKKPKGPSPPLPQLTPLPSPLLCPRRVFLAALILASKFTQDKCYSNRAWAKLSGLPPREIGRCERALGDALDWRLWVGKSSMVAEQTPSPPIATRPIGRSSSESDLMNTLVTGPFLSSTQQHIPITAPCSGTVVGRVALNNGTGLRRAATLPTDALTQPHTQLNAMPCTSESLTWIPDVKICPTSERCPEDMPTICPTNECPPTEMLKVYSSERCSSPSTPGLTYSPSSTESSSSGDRNHELVDDMSFVQMPYSDNVFTWLQAAQHQGRIATDCKSQVWDVPPMVHSQDVDPTYGEDHLMLDAWASFGVPTMVQ